MTDVASDGFSPERADDRKAEAVRRQLSHVSARRKRGDKLVSIWMSPQTRKQWQETHPRHGGQQAAFEKALELLDVLGG